MPHFAKRKQLLSEAIRQAFSRAYRAPRSQLADAITRSFDAVWS